jgi:hypothetical protein
VREGVVGAGDAADRETFQIRPGAERAALAPEDGDVGLFVVVESDKGVKQRISVIGIDGVA